MIRADPGPYEDSGPDTDEGSSRRLTMTIDNGRIVCDSDDLTTYD